jgi:hypothetical protein
MFRGELLEEELATQLEELESLEHTRDPERLIDLLERVAVRAVRIGVGALLVDADVGRFERQLAYCGFARRWCLIHAGRKVGDDRHQASSRWPSFFAALAGNHLELACELARMDTPHIVRAGEYAEAQRAVRAAALILLDHDASIVIAELAADSPELARVYASVVARDADEATLALEGFVRAETSEVLEAPADDEVLDTALAQRLSLRGLALYHLARANGLAVRLPDHDRLPALAVRLPGPPPDDIITEVRPRS